MHNLTANRFGIYGAIATITGILLSGPLGLLLVGITHPQPEWQGASMFVEHYHFIQTIPYWLGFLLVGGYVVLMSAIYQSAEERHRTTARIAVVFTAVFATMIFFNYMLQTTFVPALVRNYSPQYDGVISALSMSNPISLGWAIEMWGYGFLGVAMWFAAPLFRRNKLERIIASLFIINGVISVLGAVVTAVDLEGVLSLPGLIAYGIWNVLVLVISILVWIAFRRRQNQAA
jgi:hypothetical protein